MTKNNTENKTIVQMFKDWAEKHNSVDEILIFIVRLGNEMLARFSDDEPLPDYVVHNLAEFYEYFRDFYETHPVVAMKLSELEQYPILLEIAEEMYYQLELSEGEKVLASLNEKERHEAEELHRCVLNFHCTGTATFTTHEWVGDFDLYENILKEEGDDYRMLLYAAARVIKTRGNVVMRLHIDGRLRIVGINVKPDGEWYSIPADKLAEIYCTSPTGITVLPSKDTDFVTISRG